MSQETSSHKIKRTCDGCGLVVEYDLLNSTDEQVQEKLSWYAIARPTVFEGRLIQLSVEAHTLECIPAAAIKLSIAPQSDELPVDIESLRVNREPIN